MSGYATARWADNNNWHCDPRLPNPPLWRFVRVAAGLALLIASGAMVQQYWTASKPNAPAPVATLPPVTAAPAPVPRAIPSPAQPGTRSLSGATEKQPQPRVGSAAATPRGCTNQEIVTLFESGTPVATIIQRIQTSPAHYRTTPADLAELRSHGVPEEVIQAMVAAEAKK
jgi:hypothetical protein